ncbi:MAG TPA: cysteine--tRNA ligase [Gammaproteobacteria bacterium]|nr:cysteine--tRNA ligase [Gammaproteobacteria bacterium]
MLHIYNSMTKKKELFQPLIPKKVSLYVCGSTVYDYCHIGHGRSIMVVFDMVTRYLRSLGYEVRYVRNITDIDDKIINRANEKGEPITQLTERFIAAMREDELALGANPPDIEPRATLHISAMISLIERLIAKGYAYVAEGGVFYEVSRFADYGKFSNQSVDKLRSGARVDILETKRDPLDFALWKLAKPGEPSWDSPWGKGRPGWHIECSAMCAECLGEHIDIHGGGLDLVFPHHQNEIAQSEGAFGGRFVNTWMHVGYVQINREKMSKSLGNFSTIRDVLAQYKTEVVRYFLLASHYRSPINYTHENLASAEAALRRLYTSLRGLPVVPESDGGEEFISRFHAAMDDDFNSPLAFSVLFDLAREINRLRDESQIVEAAKLAALLKKLADIFGILKEDPVEFLQSGVADSEASEIERLIALRNTARQNKQWAEADRLRDQLLAMHVLLEDTAEGTIWRKE